MRDGLSDEEKELLKTRRNMMRIGKRYIGNQNEQILLQERFDESKNYLQSAVKLMPADPTVNDHYGDVLWMNGNKIQARYYWNYVLKLKD